MRASSLVGGTVFSPCRALSAKYFSISDFYKPDALILYWQTLYLKLHQLHLIGAHFNPLPFEFIKTPFYLARAVTLPPEHCASAVSLDLSWRLHHLLGSCRRTNTGWNRGCNSFLNPYRLDRPSTKLPFLTIWQQIKKCLCNINKAEVPWLIWVLLFFFSFLLHQPGFK